MEAVATEQSESKYKFSEPLRLVNIDVQSKENKKNGGHVYNFSLPLDVHSPLTSTFGTAPSNTDSCTGFGKRFKRSRTEWECDVCLVRNKLEVEKCVACETSRKPIIALNDASFGQQYKKCLNKWECNTCMIQNKLESTKCVACETPRKEINLKSFESHTLETSGMLFKQFRFGCTKSNADEGFKTLAAQQKASKWECSACMTQNDEHNNKCVCCEQHKPGCTKVESKGTPPPAASKFIFGFGNELNAPTENDLRKASSIESTEAIEANVGSWECTTCKTSNKNEGNACLACQSKKPVPQFKFGFALSNTSTGDTSFSALAAQQKASKWECSACMTQNDNNNNKCVCCEQKKPGSTEAESKETPSSSSTKFTFGFGNGINGPTENDLRKSSFSKNTGEIKADADFTALAVQQKNSKWVCSACITQNDINKDICVCCAQRKLELVDKNLESGYKYNAITTKFKFDICAGAVSEEELIQDLVQKNTTDDDKLKTIAAQQNLSKWECEACMTQNDNDLSKCACCTQTKAAEKMESAKQIQSEEAAPKFKFGFGNGVSAPTEEELKKELGKKSPPMP